MRLAKVWKYNKKRILIGGGIGLLIYLVVGGIINTTLIQLITANLMMQGTIISLKSIKWIDFFSSGLSGGLVYVLIGMIIGGMIRGRRHRR